jgi:hypothetical protein
VPISVTLRGDLTGTPLGTSPTYTDYSSYLETGPDGAPVDITWGRQDNRADVPAGQCSFLLDNSTGIFTTGAAVIEVDHIFNIRTTANTVTTNRFTGYVTSVEPTWPGGVQSWSVVRVTCVDVMGRLGTAQPLRSMVEQEMLADSPTFLYPLSEPASSSSAGDIVNSSSNLPLARLDSKYGPATLTFGASSTLFDSTTGVAFDDPLAGQNTSGALSVLSRRFGRGHPAMAPNSGGFTVECWFQAPTTTPSWVYVVAGQFSDDANVLVAFYIYPSGGLRVRAGTAPGVMVDTPTSSNICDGKWHHAVAVFQADYVTAGLVLDGVDLGTKDNTATASGTNLTGLSTIQIGGQVLRDGSSKNGLSGAVALYALYPTQLSVLRAQVHYQAGVGTFTERSDLRFTRIAGYGGAPTGGIPVGTAQVSGQKTAGRGVLEVLTEVARTEGSVPYPNGGGSLVFQSRSSRYNAAVSLTLTGDDISGDVPIRKDKQDFFNELTVERVGGATQVARNLTSQAGKAGRVSGGSFTVAASSDDDAFQNAAWQVAVHSPAGSRTRFPSLTIDLLSRSESFRAGVLALWMSSLVRLTSLPSQAPAASPQLFIEGGHEVIGVNTWTVEFFTSGQSSQEAAVWQITSGPDPASLLDGSNVVGF